MTEQIKAIRNATDTYELQKLLRAFIAEHGKHPGLGNIPLWYCFEFDSADELDRFLANRMQLFDKPDLALYVRESFTTPTIHIL